MAALTGGTPLARIGEAAASFLSSYAELLFARSPAVGALVLAATSVETSHLAGGSLGVVTALGVRRLFGINSRHSGAVPYGCNSLLVGLGVAHSFALDPAGLSLLVLSVAAVTLLTAALHSSLPGALALPVLSAPFLAVFPLAAAVGTSAGLTLSTIPAAATVDLFPALSVLLDSVGAVLFLPRWDAGALLLAALLVHSRIAALFATAGLASVGLFLSLTPAVLDPAVRLSASLNGMLAAIALGAIYFVPSASSLALGIAGALLAGLISIGIAGPLGRLGWPPLITPFYASVLVTLLATRQRARDGAPKAVDFAPGTPEENLRYYITQRERFSSLLAVPMSLPFRGAWTCTQGVDGAYTHQGAWRHGLDFEVRGGDGRLWAHEGALAEDHHCHHLPVLAAADGTVIYLENDVADNAVGSQELSKNWGNLVLLWHGVGLYSLVAHLAQGSVRVQAGQVVKRGEQLGLCGSSGRSPRPHLHFQLQATPELGAPTIPVSFAGVVLQEEAEEGERLSREILPAEGDTVRSIEPDDEIARAFAFPVGSTWDYEQNGAEGKLVSEVDLLGRLVLRATDGGALYFGRSADGIVAHDAIGPARSVVHLLRAAMARVPFETRAITWTDLIPTRWVSGPLTRWLRDFLDPFVPSRGALMTYALRVERGHIIVTGTSERRDGKGEALVQTRLETSARGLLSLEVKTGSRVARATQTSGEDQTTARPDALSHTVAALLRRGTGER